MGYCVSLSGYQPRKDMRVLGKVPPGATGMVRGWKFGSGRRARSNWYYFTWTNLTTGIRSHIFVIVSEWLAFCEGTVLFFLSS